MQLMSSFCNYFATGYFSDVYFCNAFQLENWNCFLIFFEKASVKASCYLEKHSEDFFALICME